MSLKSIKAFSRYRGHTPRQTQTKLFFAIPNYCVFDSVKFKLLYCEQTEYHKGVYLNRYQNIQSYTRTVIFTAVIPTNLNTTMANYVYDTAKQMILSSSDPVTVSLNLQNNLIELKKFLNKLRIKVIEVKIIQLLLSEKKKLLLLHSAMLYQQKLTVLNTLVYKY